MGEAMTRDDIIRMAEEAGFGNFEFADDTVFCSDGLGSLTTFAQLVAAHEREQIAKIVESQRFMTLGPIDACTSAREEATKLCLKSLSRQIRDRK